MTFSLFQDMGEGNATTMICKLVRCPACILSSTCKHSGGVTRLSRRASHRLYYSIGASQNQKVALGSFCLAKRNIAFRVPYLPDGR